MFKRLLEAGIPGTAIHIFEQGSQLGAGMPYSKTGANDEHITNVSAIETPPLPALVKDWIKTVPKSILGKFRIDRDNFNEYKPLPRLLFGRYLSDQFKQLIRDAKAKDQFVKVYFKSTITDIIDRPGDNKVDIIINGEGQATFDKVIICTGHQWPKQEEETVQGYYDSPYPPSKLQHRTNHAVAIRGSSLTAVDAIKTLARSNGRFTKNKHGLISYKRDPESAQFKIVLHSRNGLLPALRFHTEDFQPARNLVPNAETIKNIREANEGFVPLDYIFEKHFKSKLAEDDPVFYDKIKDLSVEAFVQRMMELRERIDAFDLLEAECAEAVKSIKRKQSIYWKELLGELSFAMSSPAKYFSAEDMLRLRRVLMPLISVVIAHVPQSSAAEMLALHHAGCLDIVTVGDDSEVEPQKTGGIIYKYTDYSGTPVEIHFTTFIDCVGQRALAFDELPLRSLIDNKTVSPAKIYFRDSASAETEIQQGNSNVAADRDGRFYLVVPGIAINDHFQVVDAYNAYNDRIYVMVVPFIGGYNPDYSGLDFCEATSEVIARSLKGEQ